MLRLTYSLTYSMVQSPSWEANWFHGTRRFITALTSVRHLSLSWASPIQTTYTHRTSWRSVLILSTHLRLGLPSGLLPSGFAHQDPIHPPLLTHTRHMPSPSHSSRFYHPHKYTLTLFNVYWFSTTTKVFEGASVLRYTYISCLVTLHSRLFFLFAERKVVLCFGLRVSVLYTEVTSDPFW